MKLFKILLFIFILNFSIGCERGSENSKLLNQEQSSNNVDSRTSELESKQDNQQLDSTEMVIPRSKEINNNSNVNSIADQDSSKDSPLEGGNQKDLIFNGDKWSLSEGVIIVSTVINLILLGLFIFLFRKNTKLNKEIETKNEKLNNKNWEIKGLERDLQVSRKPGESKFQPNNREKFVNERKEFINTRAQSSSIDEKSNELELNPKITTPSATTVVTKPKVTLYAGKPLETKIFTAVSPLQDEHKSIFRLTLENKEADRAQFEVVENEYIMKMIANSPDTYLYYVCNPENSNQNFDGRILTTKKGIANLIDGEWIVKEENKATIKFQ